MLKINKKKLFAIFIGVFAVAAGVAASPVFAKQFRSDHALFTTETDNFVTCSSNKPFIIYISVTNLSPSVQTLRIIFGAAVGADFVDYKVPAGESFSLSHAAGDTAGVDDVIKVDPLGPPLGNVNPMVGWVSVWFQAGSHPLSATAPNFCTTT